MKVKEARRLTEQAIGKTIDISAWIKHIDGLIIRAAGAGKWYITEPFSGVRMPCSAEQKRLIKEHYVSEGFTWADADRDTLSWTKL